MVLSQTATKEGVVQYEQPKIIAPTALYDFTTAQAIMPFSPLFSADYQYFSPPIIPSQYHDVSSPPDIGDIVAATYQAAEQNAYPQFENAHTAAASPKPIITASVPKGVSSANDAEIQAVLDDNDASASNGGKLRIYREVHQVLALQHKGASNQRIDNIWQKIIELSVQQQEQSATESAISVL